MNTFDDLMNHLSDVIAEMQTFKNRFRPDQYDNKTTCVKLDLGHVLNELKRGVGRLEKFRPLIEEDEKNARWIEDMEAGAIG